MTYVAIGEMMGALKPTNTRARAHTHMLTQSHTHIAGAEMAAEGEGDPREGAAPQEGPCDVRVVCVRACARA